MLAFASLVLISLGPGSIHVCPDCTQPKLCELHAREETTALSLLRKRWEAGDGAARQLALTDAAKLTQEHENAPSMRVARFLALGLDHSEPLPVRVTALQLLAHGQHAETALSEISKFLDSAYAGVCKPPRIEKLPKRKPSDQREWKDFQKDLEKLQDNAEALDEYLALHESAIEAMASLAAIGTPGARAAALRSFAKFRSHASFDGRLAAQLVRFGTRDVYRAAISAFGDSASDGAPERRSDRSGQERVHYEAGDHIHEGLLAAVRSQGLPEPELAPGEPVRIAWRAWLQAHESELPEG